MPGKDKFNLLSILEAIQKIEVFTSMFTNSDDFYQNQRDFDAVMMNFVVIGEMVLRLSEDFTEKNNHIDWFKIKGFRNIIAHNYFGIDAEEVWQIIKNDLPQFKISIQEILNII